MRRLMLGLITLVVTPIGALGVKKGNSTPPHINFSFKIKLTKENHISFAVCENLHYNRHTKRQTGILLLFL